MSATVFFADTSQLSDEKLYKEGYALLPIKRQAATDRLRHLKDRQRSLAAGLLLKAACKEYGISGAESDISIDSLGKPRFLKYPDIFFNLSHSKNRAVCIISDRNCGCDVEYIRPEGIKVAKRFFAPQETALIESCSSLREKSETFYRLWTLKESFIKTTGKGLSEGLDSFCVSLGNDMPELLYSPHGTDFFFYEFNPGDGYRYSFCFEGNEPEEIKITEYDFKNILTYL